MTADETFGATCLFRFDFPPITFEQLLLNTRFTNISFKDTNKCVDRLDGTDLRGKLKSNSVAVNWMAVSGKCLFLQFLNKLKKDFVLHNKMYNLYFNKIIVSFHFVQ